MQPNNSQTPDPTQNDDKSKETSAASQEDSSKLTDEQKARVFKSVAKMQKQGLIPKK